ncbi:pneumococcal serine-rich repeat protein [Drosophila sulfurigaster albostrigata]|uniref:pneumococcal serine-rich repeat protein n=1 Tax=Drosophila sulfurigaster albostrigata TaxID=89887 RepID=UPI002D21C927|nr:pneumococcal serine-rich repeat protein [Drosophila sulfurigaster albostrigata]
MMHTIATAKYVEQQQQHLRLDLDLGISNQQADNDIAKETNLQMPGKNCKNIQQHRGRRRLRRRYSNRGGSEDGGGFVGIFWSINLAILICLTHSTNAVPTTDINNNSASSTVVMVAVTPSSISSTSSSSSSTESVLEQQLQGQCLLDGLWVPEMSVQCEKQASCRAIQRTGHCCPDYKCDCEKDGKTYANGYKLVDPDTPCTVCYCKGGEIVCSSVTCFRRDDCMPKYVPGRCCPEYDNCPILDNNPSLGETSSVASTTTSPVAPVAPPAGFNWNITIKEITKPTEIRITDNQKAKPIFTRKTQTTEAPTAATGSSTMATTTTSVVESSSATAATTEATATTPTAAAGVSNAATAMPAIDAAATPTTSFVLSQDTNPKALPVNSSSSSESLKLIASVSYKEQQQQQQPLVAYNADDPSKVNIKREYTTEGADAASYGLSSTFIQNGFRDALVDNGAANAELEPDTAGSDNIYHIISTTEGPSGSGGSSSTERQLSTESTSTQSDLSSTYAYENSTAEMEVSTEGLPASSSETPVVSSTHSLHHMEEEDVPQVESNPAYPSLPEDDFSLRDVNFPLVELEDIVEADNKDEQRSIVSPFERDNKRSKLVTDAPIALDTNGSGNGSGSGSGDMELYQPLPSPSEQLQAQVPLMYSAEDSSAELGKIRRNHSQHETSAELESGSGSGSGELREPTTPRTRYVPVQDIDELGSGAGPAQSTAQDPKADAESLKLNESQEQSSPDVAAKSSARAEKSFVELSSLGAGGAALRPDRLFLQRIY